MADVNYKSYWGEKDLVIVDELFCPNRPKDYDDILKFSICTNVLVQYCKVCGGREDAIDAVRGSGYRVYDCDVIPGDQSGFTIKGAIDGFRIKDVTFFGHGKKSDIEIGQFDNYWYPGRPPTKNVEIISCAAADGKPIKVVVWNGESPVVSTSKVNVVKVPWIIWFPYFCWRWVAIRTWNKP